ncbi:hypothetical protein GF345_05305 [Candidatus Woesearchaeota archaeon]|nr:hypothetical protein [Candidatus Woesearchaeota archaeon]
MNKFSFNFGVDISGTPYSNTTLGLGCFETRRYNKILNDLNRSFPEFRRSRNKGCTLKKNKLKDVIKFLDDSKVHMYVLPFKGEDWNYHKQRYGQKGFFKEKIMACLYFMILSKASRAGYKNNVLIDNDSWMNLHKALHGARNWQMQIDMILTSQ